MKPKEAVYTPERCARRLRRLQALCVDLGLDALVFIPGPDGQSNRGSHQALGYLLEGHCGRDVLDLARLTAAVEDTVVVVGPCSVGVYSTSVSRQELWPLLGPAWNNLDLRCSTPEEAEDPDVLDETKIATFVQLMAGKSKVGLALTPGKDETPGNPMEAEKWALIQAYGLEGVGRSGFFTMNFQVTDVYQHLQALYAEVDAHHLDHLLHTGSRLLLQHWDEVVQGLSICKPSARMRLTERQVGEPLLSYYAYGTLRPTAGVKQVLTMMPRVVFGARTNSDSEQSSTVSVAASGRDGEPCTHFVVEAADPKSALRAARTYFFSAGDLPVDCLADEADDFFGSEKDASLLATWSNLGVPRLMKLYCALAEAARAAIRHYALQPEATAKSARQVAVDTLLETSQALGVALEPDTVASKLRYALWAADHTNAVQPAPLRGTRKAKVLRLSLHDVVDGKGNPAGALVYADTFLEASTHTGAASEVVLTEAVPCLLAFPATQGEAVAIGRLESALKRRLAAADARPSTAAGGGAEDGSRVAEGLEEEEEDVQRQLRAPEEGELLGYLIGGEEEGMILTSSVSLPAVPCRMACFAGGLVLRTRMLPPLVLDFRSHLAGLWLQELKPSSAAYGSDGMGDIIVLQGKQASCGLLPASILTPECCLGISLASFRTNARRHLMRVVLPTWEQACREMDIPLGNQAGVTAFRDDLMDAYHAASLGGAQQYLATRPDHLVSQVVQMMDVHCYTQPADASSAVAFVRGEEKISSAGIVLITGLPGSQQEDVASALVEFETTGSAWQVARLPFSACGRFTTEVLDAALEGAVKQALANASANVEPRIALVAECFQGLAAQLAAIAACRACQEGAARLQSVVVCCNAAYMLNQRHTAPPGLVEQLQSGLVDSVILSGPHDNANMSTLLQQRLPGVAVIRSARGQLLRSLDSILTKSRAEEEAMHAMVDAWPEAVRRTQDGPLQAVYVRCTGSISLEALKFELNRLGVTDSLPSRPPRVPLVEKEDDEAHPMVIRALIREADGGELQAVTGLPGAGVRVSQVGFGKAANAAQLGSHLAADDKSGAEILVFGSSLKAQSFKEMLQRAVPAPVGCNPLRTEASLTRAERQAVVQGHSGDELPDGYYFDGVSYLDPFGDRLSEHPLMAEFLVAYLEQENEKIVLKNQEDAASSNIQPMQCERACMTVLTTC